MNNDINQDVAKELVSQTAGKAYNDVAHPTAYATGQILSFIPRTIKVWLGKWEKWILTGEHSIKETELLLAEKLKHIPEEKIVEPEPYVAVPALQQMSYSFDSEELRELYANLLASSMNIDTKYDVHPAFVDIIKQLTPDEAKLLRYFSKQEVIPAVSIHLKAASGKGYMVLKEIHVLIPDNILSVPQSVEVYIQNLIRLKLLDIPSGIYYTTDSLYTTIEESVNYAGVSKEQIAFERMVINITSFGKQFIKMCQ